MVFLLAWSQFGWSLGFWDCSIFAGFHRVMNGPPQLTGCNSFPLFFLREVSGLVRRPREWIGTAPGDALPRHELDSLNMNED